MSDQEDLKARQCRVDVMPEYGGPPTCSYLYLKMMRMMTWRRVHQLWRNGDEAGAACKTFTEEGRDVYVLYSSLGGE